VIIAIRTSAGDAAFNDWAWCLVLVPHAGNQEHEHLGAPGGEGGNISSNRKPSRMRAERPRTVVNQA
jgi:hypothetical protein